MYRVTNQVFIILAHILKRNLNFDDIDNKTLGKSCLVTLYMYICLTIPSFDVHIPDGGVQGALLEPVRQPPVLHHSQHGRGRRLEVLEAVDEDVVEHDVVEVATL